MLAPMNMRARPALGLGLALLLLAGCAGRSAHPTASAETAAACRDRANAIYAERHPETRYAQDTFTSSLRDAPLATSGSPSLPTRGLGDSYEYQEILRDCLRGTRGAGPTPAAPPATAPLAAPSPSP